VTQNPQTGGNRYQPRRGSGDGRKIKSKADAVLIALSVVILVFMGSRIVTTPDQAAVIQRECDLFYGPVGPDAVQSCLVEMRRRHFLPTTTG
jgi:hypothetical protein